MADIVSLSGASKRLSQTVTVAEYRALAQASDRKRLGSFIRNRFDERYFRPAEKSCAKHGFAQMAVACLVIETLESFYRGLAGTCGHSREMFSGFFERDTPLKIFGGGNDWFYYDVRCGILHQAETRRGWRVLRVGPCSTAKRRRFMPQRFILPRAVMETLRRGVRPDERSLNRPRERDSAKESSWVEVVVAGFVHDTDA